MNRFRLFGLLFFVLGLSASIHAQTTLVCQDFIVADLNAQFINPGIKALDVLEGGIPWETEDKYYVQIDKTLPLGNGPWLPATLNVTDIGKSYQVRVTHLETGNKCWGNIRVGTHLVCEGVSNVNLDASGQASVVPADIQATVYNAFTGQYITTKTAINDQASLSLDCSKLGLQEVLLSVMVPATPTPFEQPCKTLLLVNDPLSACTGCVTCPPTANVSVQEAVNTLIPALSSGNLDAFDTYGSPAYSGGCSFGQDTTYSVTYHQLNNADVWFERKWLLHDLAGLPADSCHQSVFVTPFPVNISGKVFIDSIQNCQFDAGESGYGALKVVATRFPSLEKFTILPMPDGTYLANMNLYGTDSVVVAQVQMPTGYNEVCTNILSIPGNTGTANHQMDFGIQSSLFCYKMQVNLDAIRLRRCMDNTFNVQYCNNSLIPVSDAYVKIYLDTLLNIVSASIPYTSASSQELTFPLPLLNPLDCGTFSFVANVSCDAGLGQTLCSNASIFPQGGCDTENYTGPIVETTALCDQDSVRLAIWNKGLQDMPQALNFIVIEDIIMYRNAQFKLDAGDSITISMAANGATWRIEAQQAPDFPFTDTPIAFLEGCGGLNTPGLITAFAANDDNEARDVLCLPVIGSYDPNDKAATPTGYGEEHFLAKNKEIEYKIRFQNTGTDTAFKVVVIDTLSNLLDFAKLEAGASSHPYRLNVYPGGILHFVFDPIMLPDSNVNLAGSQGYVSFRIAQQPDLPDGSLIENKAAIYFDFNDPVITNTVFHTIGKPFVSLVSQAAVFEGVEVSVQPNPVSDEAMLSLKGKTLQDGLMQVYNAQGVCVHSSRFDGNTCVMRRAMLPAGMYAFRISENGKPLAVGKMELR